MPRKRPKKPLDKRLYALIGEVVVKFQALENDLRYSVSLSICPAISTPTSYSLFAKIPFRQLVDMYEFIMLYSLHEAVENDRLKQSSKIEYEKALQIVRKTMLDVNDRRNLVVHSTYFEVEWCHDGTPFDVTLEAEKYKRFTDLPGNTFSSFKDIHKDILSIIKNIESSHQTFLEFDTRVGGCSDVMWDIYWRRRLSAQASSSVKE